MSVPDAISSVLKRFTGGDRPPKPEARARQDTPEAIVAAIEARYQYARSAKLDMLPIWATCLAFLVGEQHRTWSDATKKLITKPMPEWRLKLTDNQFPQIIDTAASKLGRSRQIPIAKQNTDDDEDKAAAAAGTDALEHWWHVDQMEVSELESNVNRLAFGCSFYHAYWDPRKLAKVALPGENGRTTTRRAPVGDVCVEVLTPFDVFPQPCEAWRSCSWVILARRKPLSWFREMFPASRVEADAGGQADVFSSLVPGSAFSGGQGDPGAAPDGEGMATLKVLYEKPTQQFPQGRTVMIAGGQLLFSLDRLPLPPLELPVEMVPYRYVPKRLWPMGLLEHCLDQQRELNRGENNLAEILRQFRSPKWLVARGSMVDPDSITTAPDEVIEYNEGAGGPPQLVPPPPLPNYIWNYPEAVREQIRNLSGQHEVSNASTPAGVTAASAINLLQQADNIKLAGVAVLGKVALERVATLVLATIAERYREPRMVSTFGRGNAQKFRALSGADIGDRDVLVELTQGMDDSDLVRRQTVADLMGSGFFQLPIDLQTTILADVGMQWLADDITEADQATQMRVQQQQMQMAQQQALQPPQEPSGPDPEQQAALQEQAAQAQHGRALELQHVKGSQDLQKALLAASARGGR